MRGNTAQFKLAGRVVRRSTKHIKIQNKEGGMWTCYGNLKKWDALIALADARPDSQKA